MVSGKYPKLTVPGGVPGRKGKGKGKSKKAKYTIPSSSTPTLSYTPYSAASVGQQLNLAALPSAPFRLEDLPNELLQRVVSFVFCGHDPDEVVGLARTDQTMLCLGATSHHMREQVEVFSKMTLTQIGESTTHVNMEEAGLRQLQESPPLLGYTTALFHFKDKCCVFCGRASTRQSSMMSSMRTCRACEGGEWGIITRTSAREQFDLTDAQLKPEGPGPTNLPVVRRGSDGSKGFQHPATIYLYDDVVKLATAVHGDWEEHMRKKAAKTKAFQDNREAKRRAREAEAARRPAPLPIPGHLLVPSSQAPATDYINEMDYADDISMSGIPAEDSGLESNDDEAIDNIRNISHPTRGRFRFGLSDSDDVVVPGRGFESYPHSDSGPHGLNLLAQAALSTEFGGTDANYDLDNYRSAPVAHGSNTDELTPRSRAWINGRPSSQLPAPQPRDRNERLNSTFSTSPKIMRSRDISIDPTLTHFDDETYIGPVAPSNTPHDGSMASMNNTQASFNIYNVSRYFEHDNTAADQYDLNPNAVAATPDEDQDMGVNSAGSQSNATNNEYGHPRGYPLPGYGFTSLPPFFSTDEP